MRHRIRGIAGALVLAAAAVLGGCTVQQICPPVEGTVVNADTGEPIPDAEVRIDYFHASRTTRTGRQGEFSFDTQYKVFPLINVHLDRVSVFRLRVTAEGYDPGQMPADGYIPAFHVAFDDSSVRQCTQQPDGTILVAPIQLGPDADGV